MFQSIRGIRFTFIAAISEMLQLVVMDSASRPCLAAQFPFTIGRSRAASLRLEHPGVWDIHASIDIQDGRFRAQPEGQSLLLINDVRSSGAVLRMGDQLSLGGARVAVALAPAAQFGLKARELFILLLLLSITIAQVLLLFSVR